MSAAPRKHHAIRLVVRVSPRASRDELAGLHGDALRVRLRAPPVDGAANEALVDFLAARLAVPRRHLRIVSGASSRNKVVEIDPGVRDAVDRLLTEAGMTR